jgi:Skp family chaperone for outer membrane proteins
VPECKIAEAFAETAAADQVAEVLAEAAVAKQVAEALAQAAAKHAAELQRVRAECEEKEEKARQQVALVRRVFHEILQEGSAS